MCLRQIQNVDIVSYARTIRRRIVAAKNFHLVALAERDLQNGGNKVRLRIMIFALFTCATRGIEIAQSGVTQPVNPVQPIKHVFRHQLRFAICVRGPLRVILFNRC